MAWTILRPGHIYGPGSQLGCLPIPTRDPQLIAKLKRGEPLQLVGGGYFLQQPIFAPDLARLILSCARNPKARSAILPAAGPDVIQSFEYYRIIADILGVAVTFEHVPVRPYLADHPEHEPFLTHRFYDLAPLHARNLHVPDTPIAQGLRRHTQSLTPPG